MFEWSQDGNWKIIKRMLKLWCSVFHLHISFMCFRHFWQRKPNKFPSTVFDCRHRIMHTWKHFQLLCEFLQHWGRDALFLCSLYIVIITVYIKMECPWPKASKFTRAVLNLSWRIFFFILKQEKKFNIFLFSSSILFASTFVVRLGEERADFQTAAQKP